MGAFGGLTLFLSCEDPVLDFGTGGTPFIVGGILGYTF